jgi:hypothetical protein
LAQKYICTLLRGHFCTIKCATSQAHWLLLVLENGVPMTSVPRLPRVTELRLVQQPLPRVYISQL